MSNKKVSTVTKSNVKEVKPMQEQKDVAIWVKQTEKGHKYLSITITDSKGNKEHYNAFYNLDKAYSIERTTADLNNAKVARDEKSTKHHTDRLAALSKLPSYISIEDKKKDSTVEPV